MTSIRSCSYPRSVSVAELSQMIDDGLKGGRFADVIVWLCNELSALYGLEETVRPLAEAENLEFFMLELSSLLNELGVSIYFFISWPPCFLFTADHTRKRGRGDECGER